MTLNSIDIYVNLCVQVKRWADAEAGRPDEEGIVANATEAWEWIGIYYDQIPTVEGFEEVSKECFLVLEKVKGQRENAPLDPKKKEIFKKKFKLLGAPPPPPRFTHSTD